MIEKEVVAIVGPQSSAIARTASHIASALQVPIISYAASDPTLSSLQFPYFFRPSPTDSDQMAALADLIGFHGWKQIIAIFVDDDYGRNGVAALGDELAKRMSKIYKLPLSGQYNLSEISDTLNESKSLGPRVYVVHIYPDPMLKFFRLAKKLDMISSDYVWLATDWLSSTLDSLSIYGDSLEILQGVVTLRAHIPNTPKKEAFISHWRNMERKDLTHPRITAYGLYAYDTIWVVAHSIDGYLKEHGSIKFSLSEKSNFENLKVFDGGEVLLKLMSNSNFTGLTGQVQFDANRNLVSVDYEIINVVQETTRKVGYWSNDTGLRRNDISSSLQDRKLNNIIWPGGEVGRPRGWVIATREKPLRIGFPKRVSFSEFVAELKHNHSVQGYCIDLFNEVRMLVPYEVPLRFVPFGDGFKNPNYDELVTMVADDVSILILNHLVFTIEKRICRFYIRGICAINFKKQALDHF